MPLCRFRARNDGSATFYGVETGESEWRGPGASRTKVFNYVAGSFSGALTERFVYEAIVPAIPIDKRPKRGLQNYHILWEAEWSRRIPVDPMLLRRMGQGDLWLVVAAWDLTEVERAALAARL